MSVADASDEFQPKKTRYMFGDSEVGFTNVVDEAVNKKKNESRNRLIGSAPTNYSTMNPAGDQQQQPAPSQDTFQTFPYRNSREKLELKVDETVAQGSGPSIQEKRAGGRGRNQSGSSPILPTETSARCEGPVDAVQGGKFKAAVKRAIAAAKKEREAAARRGKTTARETQNQHGGEHKGFMQVQDPALNKSCIEYGLTEQLAEAKYRYGD